MATTTDITVRKIIEGSFKLLGIMSDGSTLTAAEYDDALDTFNDLVQAWNLENLLVYSTNRDTFPFVSGQQTYTLGTGGNFNMPRPTRIERASISYNISPSVEIPLKLIDVESWQNIAVKETQGTFPLYLYINNGYPYTELNFWPVPTGPSQVILYTWHQLDIAANLDTVLSLPQGYNRALKYNLAMEIASMFDKVPTAIVQRNAILSKSSINDINAGSPIATADSAFARKSSVGDALKSRGYYVG